MALETQGEKPQLQIMTNRIGEAVVITCPVHYLDGGCKSAMENAGFRQYMCSGSEEKCATHRYQKERREI